MAHLYPYNLKMTTIDTYQESTDSTITLMDYLELPYSLFEDHTPLHFYDTPQNPPHSSLYHRTIEKKRRILEYHAKY